MKKPTQPIGQKIAANKREELAAAIEAEEKQKDVDCQQEVNAALNKYGRQLSGTVSFVQGRAPVWNISITRKP